MPKIFVNRFPKIHSHDPPLLFHTPPFSLAQTPPRSLLPCINTNPSSCLSRAPPPQAVADLAIEQICGFLSMSLFSFGFFCSQWSRWSLGGVAVVAVA